MSSIQPTIKEIFSELSAVESARRLLGCELIRNFGQETVRVRIVETEAYDESDAASHSYKGQTLRTDVMFGPAGHVYVYFTYGMHYCCNVVVRGEGQGAAVLIRAVEPLEGLQLMQTFRSKSGVELTNGPAKLCQALDITKEFNGHDLLEPPLCLLMKPMLDRKDIIATKRIGISKEKDRKWRFYIRGNSYVKI